MEEWDHQWFGENPPETPWGRPEQAEPVAPGVVSVSTPGHGGLALSPERWESLPVEVRETMLTPRFAEEDCEAGIVLALFELEDVRHLEDAMRTASTFRRYSPALPHLEAVARGGAGGCA